MHAVASALILQGHGLEGVPRQGAQGGEPNPGSPEICHFHADSHLEFTPCTAGQILHAVSSV